MALFKILKGQKTNLPSSKVEGYAYVTTDEHKFYVDISNSERICLNADTADKLAIGDGAATQAITGGENGIKWTNIAPAAEWINYAATGPSIKISVLGNTSQEAIIPLANTEHSGAVSIGQQEFRGNKIFSQKETIKFSTGAQPYFINKALDWDGTGDRYWVILLLPELTAANQNVNNFLDGHFMFYKTNAERYNIVDLTVTCCYNQLYYYLQSHGESGTFELCKVIYNNIKYIALKVPNNNYTKAAFTGHVYSTLDGGNEGANFPLDLPYSIYYKTGNTVNNAEINDSITTELVSNYITAVERYKLHLWADGTNIINLNATYLASGTVPLERLPSIPASLITSGTLPVKYGGTGKASFTKNQVVLTNASSTTGALTTRSYNDSSSASALGTTTNFVTERDIYYGLPTINNAHDYNSSTTIYAPTTGGTEDTHALVGAGETTAPKWVAINPTITIANGTTAGPTIKIGVLGRNSNEAVLPSASTSASGVVTTGAQSFAGAKTFGDITISGTTDTAKRTISSASTLYLNSAASTSLIIQKGGTNKWRYSADGAAIHPETTNQISLGLSGQRWSKLFVGTTDSYGSAYKPIWWSNGVPIAVTDNSLIVNLASTSGDSVFAQNPRPGVTGTLPIANGGSGATTAAGALVAFIGSTAIGGAKQPIYWDGTAFKAANAYSTLFQTFTSSGNTLTIKIGDTEKTASIINSLSLDSTAGTGSASQILTMKVNGQTATSVSLTKGTTSAIGVVKLTDAYTSTDATLAATGKSILAAIQTLDVSAVGGGTGEYISKISETDGKISATKATTTVALAWTNGTASAGPSLKATVNNIASTDAVIPKGSTSAYGALKLTSAYTSSDSTLAATGASILAAIQTLDVAAVGVAADPGNRFICQISETDGKISATLASTTIGRAWQPIWSNAGVLTATSGYTVEYIIGTQSAATNNWTGVSKDPMLYVGKMIAYKLPYAGTSSAANLQLTMSDGTQTAVITLRRQNGNVTTHYPAGSVIFLTYDGTYWQTDGDYDSNSNDTGVYIRYNHGQFNPSTALYRYQILFQKDDSKVIPANTTSNSTANTKTTITTDKFLIFGDYFYYNTTGTVNAGTNIGVSYLWLQYPLDLRYSFNIASTLVAHKDVYLVATPDEDGLHATLRNPGNTGDAASAATGTGPITQTLPTEEDGFIYIRLGHAYSTYQITLTQAHPVYWYKGGKLRSYTTSATVLQTARNINGTAFDGHENIVTSYWGTARNIKIGATQKSVDGSGNYEWTFANIFGGNGTAQAASALANLMGSTVIGSTTQPIYWNGSAFVVSDAYSTLFETFTSSGNTLTLKIGGTQKTASIINSLSLDSTAGTSSATQILTMKVNSQSAASVSLTKATTGVYGATKLTANYTSSDSTLAATGASILKAIQTLDVASVGGGTGEYISTISETDGKISATKATTTVVLAWTNGTASAGPSIKATVNGIASTDAVIPKGSTSIYGALKLTSAYTSSDSTLAATGASILAAIQTLDVAAVGGGTGEYISKISETDGKISATKATTTVVNAWTGGTTAGPSLKTTVNSIASNDAVIPSASISASGIITTGTQRLRGEKQLEYPTITANNSRYLGFRYKNNALTLVGEHWYDVGNNVNITAGRFGWREYSPKAAGDGVDQTTTTGFYETYYLPAVTVGRTANADYNILTTKATVTVAQGGTGKSSWTPWGIIYASAATTLAQVAAGANTNYNNKYQFLMSNGAAAPVWRTALNISTGDLMPVLDNTTDFNTITTPSVYCVRDSTAMKTMTNNPFGDQAASGGRLVTMGGYTATANAYQWQFLFMSSGAPHFRNRASTTWNAWRTFVTIATNTAVGSDTLPIYVNASGQLTVVDKTKLFSALSWTAGTTAGPTLSITIGGQNRTAVIPSAAAGASGVVTTSAQTFAGNKTFQGHIYPQATDTYDLGSNALRWRYLYIKTAINLIMNADTSNYKTPIVITDTSNTMVAEIGYHNTGDTNGALILVPYAHSGTNSWGGAVGLYIGKNNLKWENKYVLRYSAAATTNQIIIADGTTGNVKTGGYTIAGLLTGVSWTAGTTAGPTVNVVVGGTTKSAAIPAASASASGAVTTGAQTFAGNKTFANIVYFANGTTYYVNASANAKFLNVDTAASNGYKIGGKGAIWHNGSNLWIGSTATNDNVFTGGLYLNAGLDGNGKRNRGALLSVGASADATTGTNYYIVHKDKAGSATKGIYLDSFGKTCEMTYSLSATINAGTANQVAYYSGANTISSKAPAWEAWVAGTTAGPQAKIQIGNASYTSAAIPSASASASGIVTTGAQTFAGNKTFKNIVYFANGTTYYVDASANARLLHADFYSADAINIKVSGSPWPYIQFSTRAGGSTYVTTDVNTWCQLYTQVPAQRASDNYYYKTRFFFRQYSKTANTTTRINYYEDYYLPETNDDRTGNAGYNILTSKNHAEPGKSTASYMAYYNAAGTITGTSSARMIDGALNLYPTSGSYREGIRIHPLSSWSDITLQGNANSANTSNVSTEDWFIGNNNGNFYITRYGSSSSNADAQRSEFSSVGNQWRLRCYVQAHKAGIYRSGLHIYGPTYGNTATDMKSGTAGLFSWGDGGPQITFDTSATPGGSQAGALIFTDHDTAATGASFHFVSNQSDWNVTSKRFHAKTSISIGSNLPNTSYNLVVAGSTFHNGVVYFGNGTTYFVNNSAVAYFNDLRSDNVRLVDNWIGFYASANAGGNRYGYIQANADRMYFRKENGVSTYHFDFNGHIYTNSNIYAPSGSVWAGTDGNTAAERQVGVQSGAGRMYMYAVASTTGNRGIYIPAHGSGSARNVFVVDTNNRVYFADSYNGTSTALAYSQSGLAASAITWLTCWNGYELRAISKAEMANAVDGSHKWVRVAGDTMTGALNFANNTQNKMGDDAYIGDQNIAGHIVIGGLNGASGLRLAAYGSNLAASIIANRTDGLTIRTESGNTWLYIGRDDASAVKGIYFPGYAGGWYMQDTVWMRSYNNKKVYVSNTEENAIYTSGGVLAAHPNAFRAIYADHGFIIRTDNSNTYFMPATSAGTGNTWYGYYTYVGMADGYWHFPRAYGAVWNDYAEYRQASSDEPGRVVKDTLRGTMELVDERLAAGCKVISDTYGFAIGETADAKTPIAVSGRVLVYPYRNPEEYPIGAAVCSAPNGTVDLMTREEIMMYPERIIGTVSEIPDYDIWKQTRPDTVGDGKPVVYETPVRGRIWIYVK